MGRYNLGFVGFLLLEDIIMPKGFSSNCVGYEGVGSVPPVAPDYIWEDTVSSPFNNVRDDIVAVVDSWLLSSPSVKYTDAAYYTLKEGLGKFRMKDVRRALKETFFGSSLREIRDAMEVCGLLPPAVSDKGSVSLNEGIEVDTAEQLLGEAIMYIPEFEGSLRERIAKFLSREG